VHAYTGEKFPNFCAGVFQAPKTAKRGNFAGMLVVKLQLKQHNFGRWESFRGLFDIPSMCHLYVSFGRGHTVWALWALEKPQLRRSVYRRLYTPLAMCLPFTFQCHSQGGSTLSFEPIHSESPYPLQPVYVSFVSSIHILTGPDMD